LIKKKQTFTYSSIYLKPGNVIQFLCRSSGRTIQIVVSKTGNELICDAIGGTGSFYPNAHWLVVCGQNGRYYFHNNYNYLAIKNSKIVIIPSTINEKAPVEAEFRVQDVLGSAQAIYLESVHMPGYFISFEDDGTVGDEIKSKTKEKFSQLEIQLVNILKSFILLEFILFYFFRLHMDLVFNLKKMIIQLKHRMKHHLHPIGQQQHQQVDQHRQHRIDNLTLEIMLLHHHDNHKNEFFCLVH